MFLIILPGPFIDIAIGVKVISFSLSLSLRKVSFVSGSVWVIEFALAFSEVLGILANVSSLGCLPLVCTEALTISIFIGSFVGIAVWKDVCTLAMSLQLLVSVATVNLQRDYYLS